MLKIIHKCRILKFTRDVWHALLLARIQRAQMAISHTGAAGQSFWLRKLGLSMGIGETASQSTETITDATKSILYNLLYFTYIPWMILNFVNVWLVENPILEE